MIDKSLTNHHFQKPIILISKCLEFEACRYNSGIISNKYICELKSIVDFIPICPEVEIGLGIPRDPIHIIKNTNKQILYQPTSGKDLTQKMERFAEHSLSKIKIVDGFIVRTKSPSCAIKTAKIFSDPDKLSPIGIGPGVFTSKILEKFPDHPIVEDIDLEDENIRTYFLTSVFTLAKTRHLESLPGV